MRFYAEFQVLPVAANPATGAKPSDGLKVIRPPDGKHRFAEACATLRALVDYAPEKFAGRIVKLHFWDSPPDVPADNRAGVLSMCSTKLLRQESRFIPFPCPYALGWPEIGVPDGPALVNEFLANEDRPEFQRVFWRGANMHPIRQRMIEVAQTRTDIFDAEMIVWDRSDPANLKASNGIAFRDHQRHRYLIDAQGEGYSARLKWLLATGRPVFVIDRSPVEHWHKALKPWYDYVPVAADLSDLTAAYNRLAGDPELERAIGERAKVFVRQNLTMEAQFQLTLDGIAQHDARATTAA